MEYAILGIVALVIGLGIGWFVGSRPAAEWRARHAERDAEAKELSERLSRMAPELAAMSERAARADALAESLDRARDELSTLKAERAGFEEQKKLLEESRDRLLKEFENTGAKVLGAAQEKFLERANERFGHSEKTSEEKIRELLAPVGERLKKYEDQVAALEEKRGDAFSRLYQQIADMQRGQEEVRREAQRLGNSLTNAPKARGRWGERALQNVLEQCGLAEHTDFHLEHSLDTDEGRLRPDAIVNVPGQKKLVIDAKVSLNAYQAAFEAEDEGERKRHLDLHAKSMRGHVQTLGSKGYQSQFDDAPDYVVMFVPGEHFVAAALEADPELWDFAFRNKVLLATPTNLVAIARTVAQVWRQDTIAREAVEIGKAGAELYDRLAIAAEHMKRVGGGLETAVSNYNKFVGSFERNVLSAGRRLADKGIEIGKREIEEVPLVEGAPRYTNEDAAAIEDARDAAE
ncbi:MAG: DNA recombination protein RmuC [Citromicrobium sp.]|nr:DNA recombination protein RmuC [Citromicrobium sp.]MAO96417.1 DNA recombination protein RmuC [Citromicrobium sp.]MBD77267.1 DNA recombination protein RmuC [Citromicrobium sp.]MBT46325.1 DNA recombination protein RmuC [Citromicrobium sp.]|tara:strand:+ start:667 stop:2052 length:1386 start_codon:yes stop_codon:yes gene_type:complete